MVNVTVTTGGTSGPRGTGWLNGTGTPASSLGFDGDFYLDETTPNSPSYWGPKTAGTWVGHGPYTFGSSSGTVTSVTAANTSIVVGGTGTAPTVRTNTLDVVATQEPPAANWSNNGHKIQSVANGTVSGDAVSFDQLPTALPPSGSAAGDLSGTYPNPGVNKVKGVAVTGTAAYGRALVATDSADAVWQDSAIGPWIFNVKSYGALGNAKVVNDGAISSTVSTTTLTCSTSTPFVSGDVGKSISIKGASSSSVTTLIATISTFISSSQVTISVAATTTVTGAIVIFGTNDTAAIQSAINAAETYLAAGNTYAQVYFPPSPYVVAGALNTTKSGNGQLVFGVYPTTSNKPILEFRGETDGAAAVRHWQQTVPQFSGSCLISLGVYASTSAQVNDINAHGNPGVICGPNEGSGYGVAANFNNIMAVIKNLAIGTTHSAFGLTYGAFNLYGCANSYVENVGGGTMGTVASPSTDYTSPTVFANGLSIAALIPANGNNDHNIVNNFGVGGGYTYGLFLTEHGIVNRYMALYCWAGLCAVGTYFSSVGSTHAMKVLQASIEACTQELYIVGAGSSGIGPIVDIDQLQTESGTPTISGNSSVAINSALGTVKLTGIFLPAGVNVTSPTGLKVINGQVARAVIRKTVDYTVSIIDEMILVDATAAPVTITLINANYTPNQYTIIKIDSSGNAVTAAAAGGQTINGAATQSIPTQYATATYYSAYDGTSYAWFKK